MINLTTEPVVLTLAEQHRFMTDKMYECYRDMEANKDGEAERYRKLFHAYETIVLDLRKKLKN